jgi:hypothetical protein
LCQPVEGTSAPWSAGKVPEFIDAIEPVQEALFTLVDAEPDGELAEVLACLIHAAAHLGTGDVTAGRTAMSAAYHILIRWRWG